MTLQRASSHHHHSWTITELNSNLFLHPGAEVNREVFFYNCIISLQSTSTVSAEPHEWAHSYFLQRGNWTADKKSKMRGAAERRGGWKAVGIMSIHTHNLEEEFSGQDYQANDKVVFWQISNHQPSAPWIFTVVFRMSGRFHTGTSEFSFWAQRVVL